MDGGGVLTKSKRKIINQYLFFKLITYIFSSHLNKIIVYFHIGCVQVI